MSPRADDRPLRQIEVRHQCGCRVTWALFLEETTEAQARASLEALACLRCRESAAEGEPAQ